MSHVHSQKIRRAFYVAGILTGMFFVPEMLVDAANLMVTIPSNYSSSIMGTITGSRVTTTVDGTPQAVRTKNLNGDPGVYADITRSFGGDYEMQWKLNAGIRYAF